jgi:hypothetical protein
MPLRQATRLVSTPLDSPSPTGFKQRGAASPDQVAARIAHVRNDGAVVTQRVSPYGAAYPSPG